LLENIRRKAFNAVKIGHGCNREAKVERSLASA